MPPPLPEPLPEPPSATFVVAGPRRRAVVRVDGSFLVVGRTEALAVFRDDPKISREHAALAVRLGPGGRSVVRLRDLGSRNGVVLGGRRLGRYEEVDLPPGVLVQVGDTELRLLDPARLDDDAPTGLGEAVDVVIDRDGAATGRRDAMAEPAEPSPAGDEDGEQASDEQASAPAPSPDEDDPEATHAPDGDEDAPGGPPTPGAADAGPGRAAPADADAPPGSTPGPADAGADLDADDLPESPEPEDLDDADLLEDPGDDAGEPVELA